MNKKRGKHIALIAGIPLAVIGMIYLCTSLYFQDRFYYGTWINGIDCSGMTVVEATNRLMEYDTSYILRIAELDGTEETILGTGIGYTVSYEESISGIKQRQSIWLWPKSVVEVNFYQASETATFNEEKLMEALNNLSCISGSQIVDPQDAYVDYNEQHGFVVVEEVRGNRIDATILFEVAKTTVEAGESRINLEESGCYIQPQVTKESKEIQEFMAPIEAMTSIQITYQMGDNQEVIDGTLINSWLYMGEEENLSIDRDKIAQYVEGLAATYDTVGNSREFVTSNGNTVTVQGGNYGWQIDVEAETAALLELLEVGESVTREPIYLSTAYKHGGNEIGNTYIEISIDEQHMWYYKGGQLIIETDIVTGNPYQGNSTPVGSYKVLNKHTSIILKGEGYESFVNYWIGFKGTAYGLHDASWRSSYGGSIYLGNGSHGCVNTPYANVQVIFNDVEIGTPVLIY